LGIDRFTTYTVHIQHGQGIAIGDGAQVIQHVASPALAASTPPAVTVTLLTRVVPTATCHHLDAAAFPLVTAGLDNTGHGCQDADVRITAVIEGYSDTATASAAVPAGERTQVTLLPLLRPAAVASLNEIRPATLRIVVEQTASVARGLYDRTERIHLHARDTALLALQAPDGSIVDLADYLAAWVTPRRPEIERLLRAAAERHPDRRFVGYQGAASLAQGAAVVREQARAIFAGLKEDAGLVYVNSPLSLGAEAGQIAQRVRLPSESLAAGGSANCLDGAVLFASLLELTAVDTLLVIVPGHAFAGWRVWQGIDRYEFVETTLIGYADFDAAQASAQASHDDALMRGYFKRGLFDPAGFARVVDVTACREKGIHPLE